MFAALILNGGPGAPGSSILAVTYDPPRRRARPAPSNLRDIAGLADFAATALAMADLVSALPSTPRQEPKDA